MVFGFGRRKKEKALQDQLARLQAYDDEKSSNMLTFANEYLKRTQKEHASALSTAQRLNKANLMDLQTQQLKREMSDLLNAKQSLDEDDDAQEDDEDDEGPENKLLKPILNKFMESLGGAPQQKNSQKNTVNSDELETPSQIKKMSIPELRQRGDELGFDTSKMSDAEISALIRGL